MADQNIPELLFHTTLTVIDFHIDTSGSTQSVYVLGTHTTLESAKAFTLKALEGLGYQADDFDEFETRTPDKEWTHGDGILVYAKAPAGRMFSSSFCITLEHTRAPTNHQVKTEVFKVGLDTKPNTEKLPADPKTNTLVLPRGHDHLHYVLQTKIDYNQDKSGAYQTSEIEGCYVKRGDAVAAAREALAGMDREAFSQYDERDNVEEKGQWPFGEDVVVHAVAETGENYTVSVRTVPGAHKQYGKKH